LCVGKKKKILWKWNGLVSSMENFSQKADNDLDEVECSKGRIDNKRKLCDITICELPYDDLKDRSARKIPNLLFCLEVQLK